MSVAKVTEIISSSNKSFDDAVENGVKRASKTLKDVKSVWIKEQKAMINDGKISEYRVTMKVSYSRRAFFMGDPTRNSRMDSICIRFKKR